MPKKRHQTRYSKPQSTAPSSLSIGSPTSLGSSSSSNNNNNNSSGSRGNSHPNDSSESRGVNEILADLRRARLAGAPVQRPVELPPTLPPALRSIFQLPEAPPLRTRRHDRRTAGPPAPRSWLSSADRAASLKKMQQYGELRSRDHRPLPGQTLPDKGSLTDIVLKQLAHDWDFQREYNHFMIYELPTHLRSSLLTYLGLWYPEGVSLDDLRVLLLPPEDDDEADVDGYEPLHPTVANDTFHHLDLAVSIGRSITLPQLSKFLFPHRPTAQEAPDLQESWDDDEPAEPSDSVPRPILPHLTHLSLEVRPDRCSAVSWRQLLSFAARCPTLTHLSLAYWPKPCLTPGAELATVVTPQGRTIAYSGTGPYSHSLDNDWSEAILLLRRLSKTLYSLESLDLTGCGDWTSALWASSDGDRVDWVGDWGKVTRLRLGPGYRLAADAEASEREAWANTVGIARLVEMHVWAQRKGRGRGIVVECAGAEGL